MVFLTILITYILEIRNNNIEAMLLKVLLLASSMQTKHTIQKVDYYYYIKSIKKNY
jgi:hypothetical protein